MKPFKLLLLLLPLMFWACSTGSGPEEQTQTEPTVISGQEAESRNTQRLATLQNQFTTEANNLVAEQGLEPGTMSTQLIIAQSIVPQVLVDTGSIIP